MSKLWTVPKEQPKLYWVFVHRTKDRPLVRRFTPTEVVTFLSQRILRRQTENVTILPDF